MTKVFRKDVSDIATAGYSHKKLFVTDFKRDALTGSANASVGGMMRNVGARMAMMIGGANAPVPQMTLTINGSSFTSNVYSNGLSTNDGSPITIDWGDGTQTTSASGTSLGNHTYPTSGTWIAKVYSDGILTRIEKNCFNLISSLVDIDIPNTVTYLGDNCLRQTGLTSLVFQRQFTYGDWPIWGNRMLRFRFEGKFIPCRMGNVNFQNGNIVEFGEFVDDNDINVFNSAIEIYKTTNVVVDSRNPYYEVRGQSTGVPQIVRKSDNCLIYPAFGLIGNENWDGSGVDPSVRAFRDTLTRSLKTKAFTFREGVEHLNGHICRDSDTILEVNMPSTTKTFGFWPFYNSPNLSTINCLATTPPVQSGSFGNFNTGAVVHVPSGSLSSYRSARFWSSFTTIIDDL